MSVGQLVVCGLESSLDLLQDLASELELDLLDLTSFQEQKPALEQSPPTCFLVDHQQTIGEEVCLGVRMSSKLVDTPVVALLQDPWSDALSDAFSLGIDDFLPVETIRGIKQKLLALRKEGTPTGTYLSGQVILADPERERRVHLARHLRKMGLRVEFAVDAEGIASDVSVKLVVAHCSLAPDGAVPTLKQYRKGPGAKIPWVITGNKLELDRAKKDLGSDPLTDGFDIGTDAAQMAFTANKLLIGSARSMRRSPRLTYEGAILFHALGGSHTEWGYTYNINRGGLYIRTLTPPALGSDLDLEFVPPHGRGHVKVEGKVVWRQEYTGSKGYPPGFGVQYGDLPIADAAGLDAGYNQLIEDNGNPDA